MTEAEALLYTNVLANLPTDYQIPSTDLNTLADNNIIKAIFIQMEKDGYVQTTGRHTDYSISATLLPAGIVFRNKGGYVQKRREEIQNRLEDQSVESRKNNLERAKTIAALASAIIALLALIFSISVNNRTEKNLLEFEKRLETLEKDANLKTLGTHNMTPPIDTATPDSNLKEKQK
jgi:hypothetical protein